MHCSRLADNEKSVLSEYDLHAKWNDRLVDRWEETWDIDDNGQVEMSTVKTTVARHTILFGSSFFLSSRFFLFSRSTQNPEWREHMHSDISSPDEKTRLLAAWMTGRLTASRGGKEMCARLKGKKRRIEWKKHTPDRERKRAGKRRNATDGYEKQMDGVQPCKRQEREKEKMKRYSSHDDPIDVKRRTRTRRKNKQWGQYQTSNRAGAILAIVILIPARATRKGLVAFICTADLWTESN